MYKRRIEEEETRNVKRKKKTSCRSNGLEDPDSLGPIRFGVEPDLGLASC